MSNSVTLVILLEISLCLKGLYWEAMCTNSAESLTFGFGIKPLQDPLTHPLPNQVPAIIIRLYRDAVFSWWLCGFFWPMCWVWGNSVLESPAFLAWGLRPARWVGRASGEGGARGSQTPCLRVSVCSHCWAGAGVAWAASPHTRGPCGALCNFRGALGDVCRPHAVSCFCSAGVRVWESRCPCLETAGFGELR